jgi:hypothetical protein
MPRGTPFHEKKSFEELKRLDRENTDLDIHNLEKYAGCRVGAEEWKWMISKLLKLKCWQVLK